MPTPLYAALRDFAAKGALRMHMPGHKGKPLPLPELAGVAAIDFTELPPTGNLFQGGEPFDAAQELWARDFGFDHCQFLTGGSTMGIHTGLSLLCRPGDQVLIDRGCHRSVYHALALLDLEPVYLERPWLAGEGTVGGFVPSDVEKLLEQHPKIKTVCITSPTYCGLLSNIAGISQIIHARGGKLMVDGAHGAHLPFLGIDAFSGADVVVVSAHKTLPAMGQSALLFTRGFQPAQVRRMASVYGSSSPSYPMMASLDGARDYIEGEGAEQYRRVANRAAKLREKFPSLQGNGEIDPCRLTVKAKDGPALTQRLEWLGVYPEMEDGGHVVFILTCADSEADLDRLERALEANRDLLGERREPLPPPPLPQQVCSPREALFGPTEERTLAECEGEICACQIAPYPPGVPVVAPGERITKKELAYLRQIGYNINLKAEIAVQP
jgi:lysine decarboxylase